MKHPVTPRRALTGRLLFIALLFSFSVNMVLQARDGQSSTTTSTVKADGVIRIKAGIKKSMTDSEGHEWLPDQGFVGGVIADRDVTTPVANTKTPELYRSERYNMTSFSRAVPNGKYIVKLHFAEMYERIAGVGERLFSVDVQGQKIKDLDLWVAAGGARRAHIETFKVEVADGKLTITFTKNKQFPVVHAIEIIPDI